MSTGNIDDPNASPARIRHGTAEYRRASSAMSLVGFANFSLIYCVQPLLPRFVSEFGISPAQSSLALSYTTGSLAVMILVAVVFSHAFGRKGLIFTSMLLGSFLSIIASLADDWHILLVSRLLEGIMLGGVPAVAMAWLAEEIHPKDMGRAIGIYVGSTAFGAMIGRVGIGVAVEYVSWRTALGGLGMLCILATMGFALLLPPSHHAATGPAITLKGHIALWARHLRNRDLLHMFLIGFLLTSISLTLYNYASFHLSKAPYYLSQTQISFLFLTFGLGMVSSPIAGRLADRFGRKPLLVMAFIIMASGILLTLSASIVGVLAGIAMVTTGFFIGHATASASVGALANSSKSHATSLYLLFYYTGASITGTFSGWFWQHAGWSGITALTGSIALTGLMIASTSRTSPRTP